MPNTALGLLTSLGVAEESAYGAAATASRFFEVLTEGLERNQQVIQSNGLRAGGINLRRGSRRGISRRAAGGPFSLEVPTTGFGVLLKHAMGGTPTIAQQLLTPAYLQTHALGSNVGKSLTVQKVLRDGANAVVQQFTQVGTKILSVEFTIDVDGLLRATFETDGRDENVSTAAAAPSYPNNRPFNFTEAALTLAGSPIAKATAATWRLTRPQRVDGYYLGGGGLKAEPVENDHPTVTGSVTAEFDSANKTALYDAYAADTGLALVITFTGAVISGAYSEQIRFTIPEIHLLGETPKVGGPGVITVAPNFEAAYNGSAAGMTVEYQSTDTAI